jgi:phytoene synthase|tara:strand:- start:57 stop:887 length:831 start_codon:yes stop_codon:yes gene_type:complete
MKISYCASEVKAYDPDRYLTALFAPKGYREAIFSLYAFNSDIARTRELVSEPILGQIRLKWWDETISSIYEGETINHPVVMELAKAIKKFELVSKPFYDLIKARSFDLNDSPLENIDELEAYALNTSGVLSRLAMNVLGYSKGAPIKAANLIGTAWALIGLMRSVGFHAQNKRVYIPESLIMNYNLSKTNLLNPSSVGQLKEAIKEVVCKAEEKIVEARDLKNDIPKGANSVLLLAAIADSYISLLKNERFDPTVSLQSSNLKALKLTIRNSFGSY